MPEGPDDTNRLYVGTYGRTRPDQPAVMIAGTDEHITFGELDRGSNALAHALRAAGCQIGDHIAILMETHLLFPQVCWAALRSGLHYTPINTRLAPAEAAYIVQNSGAKVVIASYAQRETAAELRAQCPTVGTWLMADGVIDGFESYEKVTSAQPTTPIADETEGAPMLYSSGTTGRPKGVKRTLSGNPPGSSVMGIDPAIAMRYGIGVDSVSLIPTPLYHSSGMFRLMMCTSLGSPVVLMRKFDAEQALAAIEHYKVTHGLWVGTMFVRILRLDETVRESYDLSSMTDASVGSGPCPIDVKRQIIEWWGPIVSEQYGGTEGNGQTRITAEEWLERPGSVGRPLFGEPHIVKDDGTEAGPNEVGIIYFTGGRKFEYHLDPEKTASVHNDKGWSTLGDVGYLDPEGYLYITDRIADLVISGGVNIYPREVEDILILHPKIDDVAVLGVPSDEFGEEVKAVVKPRAGVEPNDALAEELIGYCRDHLAHYKCPRSIDFVDELPRNDTGKMYKRILRDKYWAGRTSKLV